MKEESLCITDHNLNVETICYRTGKKSYGEKHIQKIKQKRIKNAHLYLGVRFFLK